MLALFRSHYAFNHLFLLGYIILIRLSAFLGANNPDIPVESWLMSNINNWIPSSFWQGMIGILVLWVESILVNNIVNSHKLSRESTLFPGLMFVLFMSILPESLYLHPVLVSTLFILAAMNNVVEAGKQIDIRHLVFNAGFFFMISIFIMPQNLYMIILGLAGFYSIKSLKFLDNIRYLVGIITAMIILFSWQFLLSQQIEFNSFFQLIQKEVFTTSITAVYLAVVIVFTLFLLFIFIQYPSIISKKNIQVRKKIELFYVLLFFLLLTWLTLHVDQPSFIIYLGLPLGALTGIWMADNRSVLVNELIHLMVLAVLIVSQYILS